VAQGGLVRLDRGSVVLVDLDPTVGHEQYGSRFAVVVSDPAVVSHQRFPLLCVVPITGTQAKGALYPELGPGPSGLKKPSFALVDQLRSVDKRRVRRVYGHLPLAEMQAIDEGLMLYLGLGGF
jgi:mRNA interferase MazF